MSAAVGAKEQGIPVLVVEDDLPTYEAMRALLEHYGFDPRHAATASEALELLSSNPRYVFLDLMLPDRDGSCVLEHIRKNNLPIEVAVITGTSDPDRIRRVERLKPELLLRKPLDFITLLERIKPKDPSQEAE